jgi:hypothetical protein
MQALGLAGGATLLPSLRPREAAAEPSAPKRFLVFYTYHGIEPQDWVPASGGETDFGTSKLIDPFYNHKKDLVLLDGLDMKSHDLENNPQGNAHQQGQNHALAAISAMNADLAGGPTIDQVIAQGLKGKTRFSSLELGINTDTSFPDYHYIAHSGPGQKLPTEADPRKVWDRVFKGYTPPSAEMPSMPAGPSEEQLRQKSIIDFAAAEIDSVKGTLSAGDKLKLEAHQQALRDLETTLGLIDGGTSPTPTGKGCSVPPRELGPNGEGNLFEPISNAQIALATMAFACDLTRVASINVEELMSGPACAMYGYTDKMFGSTDAHDLIHRTSQINGDLKNNADAVAVVDKHHLVHSKLFNKLLDSLANTPDVDGKRLLDNTIVLWAGEIAEGGHNLHDLKWVLAGGGGGSIKTGRWLKCNHAPHNNLFVSLANAMDVPISTFGNPAACTGSLAGL